MWGRGVRRSACRVLRHSESSPLGLSVRKCGATGSASAQTACPVCPTLHQSQSRHGHASPLRPGCPSLPLLPVWMNVYFLFPWCWISLPFDFLSVLVVRGGTVCPPTPPSWFSQCQLFPQICPNSLLQSASLTSACQNTLVHVLQLPGSFVEIF